MLLSFSVENFRSFGAEETLNLLAAKRIETNPPHCCEIPDIGEHALRVASLYGANGAGKSNLVRALDLLKRLVLQGTSPGEPIPHEPFLLDAESPTQPSSFELQFLQEGEVFRYGVCYDAERVHEEWLAVYEGKKERNLFTRVSDEDGAVTVSLGPTAKDASHPAKIKALAEVGARPNQLFLTEVVNLDDPEAQGPRFERAIKWFSSTLAIIKAGERFKMLAEAIATDEMFAKFAARFLCEANTGIADLTVQTSEVLRSQLASTQFGEAGKCFENHPAAVGILRTPRGEEMLVVPSAKDAVKVRRILALHDVPGKERTELPFHQESDGSQRL
ncbi:MAG: AAA family ATPase, partial [Planctomycetes bacterium]|nr:AAA family ATPase [Planctomycetota bacterium]